MKSLFRLKEKILSTPKIIIGLSIIFFILSFFSAITGFEMYLNEEQLIKNNFENDKQSFYFLFIIINGLSVFFFFLGLSLWRLKEWSRYFLLGSSFLSTLYVSYYIIILSISIIDNNYINIDKQLEMLLLNILYLIIYLLLIKYLIHPKIENSFKKNVNFTTKENFFSIKNIKDKNKTM